jgi:hypothetical protein
MAPATHQPAPSDTQGNASRQLAVVVVFGRRVVPALWRLTFAAPISWVSLSVGGSGLAVHAAWTYTCRAYDSAAVVLERPGRGRPRLEEIIKTKISTNPAVEDTASRRRGLRIFHSAKMGSACSEDTRLRYGANLANFGRTW